jgi:protein-disulfide isomerase
MKYCSIFLTGLFVVSSAWAQSSTPPKGGEKLATVDGHAITESDLEPIVQGQLRPLRDQEYQIKRKALDTLITQRLVDAEAKKKGLTTDKFLEQEVDAKVGDPSDAELNGFYLAQKGPAKGTFEEVKVQLQASLKQAKIQQARQDYLTQLRKRSEVAVLLQPEKVEVSFDPGRVRGNPKAPVMVVEFSDFQCPYCQAVESTLKSVLAKHENQVALAFRDFPLTQIHSHAQGAAEASRCAGEQGKFWEYHDLLFASQNKLDHDGLLEQARTLKLNEKQFEGCITSEKYKAQVEQDEQAGRRVGLSGTPGFFINGIFLSGNQPEAVFESSIQDALSALPKKPLGD